LSFPCPDHPFCTAEGNGIILAFEETLPLGMIPEMENILVMEDQDRYLREPVRIKSRRTCRKL